MFITSDDFYGVILIQINPVISQCICALTMLLRILMRSQLGISRAKKRLGIANQPVIMLKNILLLKVKLLYRLTPSNQNQVDEAFTGFIIAC